MLLFNHGDTLFRIKFVQLTHNKVERRQKAAITISRIFLGESREVSNEYSLIVHLVSFKRSNITQALNLKCTSIMQLWTGKTIIWIQSKDTSR